jgi:hypothetical protein
MTRNSAIIGLSDGQGVGASQFALNGQSVDCCACGGHGLVATWDGSPDECRWCDGTGRNWRYSGGAIARYYGGPLIGRDHPGKGRQ